MVAEYYFSSIVYRKSIFEKRKTTNELRNRALNRIVLPVEGLPQELVLPKLKIPARSARRSLLFDRSLKQACKR